MFITTVQVPFISCKYALFDEWSARTMAAAENAAGSRDGVGAPLHRYLSVFRHIARSTRVRKTLRFNRLHASVKVAIMCIINVLHGIIGFTD